MHVFLTGERGVGKSTALKKALALLNAPCGGYETYFDAPRFAWEKTLYLRAYGDCAARGIAVAQLANGRAVRVERLAFDAIGAALLRRAATLYPLIVMDECGKFEGRARAFQREIGLCLDGETPVAGVVRDADVEWLKMIREHPKVRVIRVTPENRDQAPALAARLLRPALAARPRTPWRYNTSVRYELDRLDLYNAQREPIGPWDRDAGNPEGVRLHVGVWVRDGRGRLLLTRRHPHMRVNPGLYENPGGHVLSGETSRQAAVRELFEETGLRVPEESLAYFGTARGRDDFSDSFIAPCAAPPERLVLQPDEADAALWADPAQVREMIACGQAVRRVVP